uniref:Uncharacterized protein n=1 Tax=Physcomitrium patens TaxID=3218 RepID=A0A2K1L424_PHYPA|nr:hypothetical protein PHYPA_003573 [Physcomitrium patens]
MNFAAKGEVLSYTECDHAVPITGQKILMLALSKIIPKTECTQNRYVYLSHAQRVKTSWKKSSYRMGDKYLQVIFDTDLVTDAFELMYSNQEARLELESQAIVKSFTITTLDEFQLGKFVGCMVSKPETYGNEGIRDGGQLKTLHSGQFKHADRHRVLFTTSSSWENTLRKIIGSTSDIHDAASDAYGIEPKLCA